MNKDVITQLAVGFDGASKLLGISRATLHNHHNSGLLGPIPIRFGGRQLFSVRELSNWVEARMPDRATWQMMLCKTEQARAKREQRKAATI